jgi:hypothetical protein
VKKTKTEEQPIRTQILNGELHGQRNPGSRDRHKEKFSSMLGDVTTGIKVYLH